MKRGSTPILYFSLPFEPLNIEILNICFSQRGVILFEKNLNEVDFEGNVIICPLNEEETLSLKTGVTLRIQLRCGIEKQRFVSQIFELPVEKILKEGVLE